MYLNYYKNDPLKPIMIICIILYKFTNNKLYILLCKNNDGKYDLIHTNNDNIIERIYNATNYLILLDITTFDNNFNEDFYDETTFTLIKFIKLPDNYLNVKSEDFNNYEIITDEIKVKRELKWIDLKYFNNFIIKNNKITSKLKNKDITKNLNSIHKKISLDLTLNKINYNYIFINGKNRKTNIKM